MKKIIAVVLALALSVSSFGIGVYAEDLDTYENEDITVYYLYTGDIASYISISSKTATCTSYVDGDTGVTKIAVTQTLQKKDGNSWRTVTSWSKTYYDDSCNYVNTYSSLNGGTYRTKTVAKVYRGTAYETITNYSSSSSC